MGFPRFFQTTSKKRRKRSLIFSQASYFKKQALDILLNYFKNKSHRGLQNSFKTSSKTKREFPQTKYFKNQILEAPAIPSNYILQEKTQMISEIFLNYFKNKRWYPKIFSNYCQKQNKRWSLRFLRTRSFKNQIQGIPQILSNCIFQKKPERSPRFIIRKQKKYPRSLKLLQKLGTRGPQGYFKLLQKQDK